MHIYRTLYICILPSKIQFQFTRVAVAAELIFYVKWFLRKRYCKTWLKPIWIRVPTSYSQLRLDLLHNHRIRRVFFFRKFCPSVWLVFKRFLIKSGLWWRMYCMYFDVGIVFVTNFLLLFRLARAILYERHQNEKREKIFGKL